jgi:hypothetical protein
LAAQQSNVPFLWFANYEMGFLFPEGTALKDAHHYQFYIFRSIDGIPFFDEDVPIFGDCI